MSIDVEVRRSSRRPRKITYAESEGSESESDYEEEVVPKKRKLNNKSSHKTRIPQSIQDLGEDFVENELYKAVCNPEVSITELVLEWVESYEEDETNNTNNAICNLVNLILRCCGCIHLFKPHDLLNLDSSEETVGELIIAFQGQKSHEYPFISNNKDLKFFRTNVVEFFTKLTELCHNRELLYVDPSMVLEGESLSSGLINKIFTWLLAFSSCSVRPLRLVSTTIIMDIQTELCVIIQEVSDSLEKLQTQLSNSKKKSARNQKARLETIENNIRSLSHQKNTLQEYITEIIDSAFVKRYKDIDPLIRQECVIGICNWQLNYPEMFLQSRFLDYLSLLLSDPNSHVRSELLRCLNKLYKHINQTDSYMESTVRHFAESSINQIIQMSLKDNDLSVRINGIAILEEFNKLELLTHEQEINLCSVYMEFLGQESGLSKISNDKLNHEYGKFINLIRQRAQKSLGLEDESIESINTQECLRIKSLISVLKEANVTNINSISTLYTHFYQLSEYKNWIILIEYLLFDFSNVGDSTTINYLELSNEDKAMVFAFLHGALSNIVNRKKSENSFDDRTKVVDLLLDKLDAILVQAQKSTLMFEGFIRLWSLLLSKYNVSSIFQTHDKLELYNKSIISICRYYKNEIEYEGESSFDDFFESYFTSKESSTITSGIMNEINDLLFDLSQHVIGEINDVSHLEKVSIFLRKINIIGKFLDISKYIEESTTDSLPVFDLVKINIFDKIDFDTLINTDISYLTQFKVKGFFQDICNSILIMSSSKMEILINSSQQEEYDISYIFRTFNPFIQSIWKVYGSIETATSSLNSKLGSSQLKVSMIDAKTAINQLNDLKTILITTFIDLIVSLRIFHDKFPSNEFENFSQYFHGSISNYINGIPLDLQHKILNLFLIKESALAKELNVELDRSDNEAIDYSSDIIDESVNVTNNFDSDEEDEETASHKQHLSQLKLDQEKKTKIWNLEQDLCLYTVKIFSLIKIGIIDSFIINRIKLNGQVLGSVFSKITSGPRSETPRAESQPPVEVEVEIQDIEMAE